MEYLSIMTTGYKIQAPSYPYFLTFQVVDWVDIFSRKVYRDIVLDSLDYEMRENRKMKSIVRF